MHPDKDVATMIHWLRIPPRFTVVRVNLNRTTREALVHQLEALLSKVEHIILLSNMTRILVGEGGVIHVVIVHLS